MTAALILVVEDEVAIRRLLRNALSEAGYCLAEASTAAEGVRLAVQQPPELILLDLGLPDEDGQELIKRFREWLKVPIIILSARDQEQQKVSALDNGADDYLTKPFSSAELLARVRVALRHSASVAGERDSPIFIQGDLKVDLASRRVFVAGSEVHLTPIEFKLLTTLTKHAGKVLTHRYLLKEVWGPNQVHETHYLRVFMAGLRKKIESDSAQPRYLLTEPGIGYRLASDG